MLFHVRQGNARIKNKMENETKKILIEFLKLKLKEIIIGIICIALIIFVPTLIGYVIFKIPFSYLIIINLWINMDMDI